MPGILIGSLLTFILSLGSLAESKILGGQAVIMIADEIETAFTFGQNWPLGSALSVLLIAFDRHPGPDPAAAVDLDAILGRGGRLMGAFLQRITHNLIAVWAGC